MSPNTRNDLGKKYFPFFTRAPYPKHLCCKHVLPLKTDCFEVWEDT